MASDATRLHFSIAFFHWLPSSILQLLVAMYILYSVVGIWPLVSAMATMVKKRKPLVHLFDLTVCQMTLYPANLQVAIVAQIISLPISYWASKQRKVLNDKLMERRDLRVGRTNELVGMWRQHTGFVLH
jgi:hypothetical protein